MMLTDLANVLRAANLSVQEEPGWKARGHGQMVDVRTVIAHHSAGPKTGDLPSLRTVRDGRPGLPGPLAQLMVSRSGVWHVVAAGLCYHAGVSRDPSFTNSHAIGIEAEATGLDAWPAVQWDSYVRGARALADHYKVPYSRVLGHKETCAPKGRKTDPNFDMAAFRAALSSSDTGGVMASVWDERIKRTVGTGDAAAGSFLVSIFNKGTSLLTLAVANAAQVAALRKEQTATAVKVDALTRQVSAYRAADTAAVKAAAKAGTVEALTENGVKAAVSVSINGKELS